MPLRALEGYPAGGVDSRSNPLAMPASRYLQVHDLWPQQDGSFRLRDGYTLLARGLQPGVPIHSIVSVTGPAPTYAPLVVFWQGKIPYVLNQSSNTVAAPLVRGVAIQSSSRFSYFYTNGHLHAFNGTDAKWFDGVVWRDIGLPTLTAAQSSSIVASTGLKGITSSQGASASLTFSSGGGWQGKADSGGDSFGRSYYFSLFNPLTNEISPGTQLGGGPILGAVNQKLAITGLPAVPSGLVGLISMTDDDGGANTNAYFEKAAAIQSYSGSGGNLAIGQTGNRVVVRRAPLFAGTTGFAVSVGDIIEIVYVDAAGIQQHLIGPVTVTEVLFNPPTEAFFAFTYSPTLPSLAGGVSKIFLWKLVPIAAGGTSGAISGIDQYPPNITFGTPPFGGTTIGPRTSYVANNQGLAASSIGGPQPGYQLYASIYNLVTGHVGNRTAIGSRIAPTAPANFLISGLPDFSLIDSEWVLLIGRTSDGAQIPYAVIDKAGNWISASNGSTSLTVSQPNIDGSSELPSRSFPPPGALDYNYQLSLLPGGAVKNPPVNGTFDKAWVESDHCCGTLTGSPTIYRSGSAQDMREGQFVGLAEQSWDPADIETFPTGNPVVCGRSYQQESWCYSKQDCAVLLELAGETQWQGPWNVGAAGQFAWARGWQNLPFWVTGQKQLATVSLGGWQQLAGMTASATAGPIVISTEYEAALLAKIGSAYLSQTEVSYIQRPDKLVDVLRIKCLDTNGNPFTIIHDFNLRDERSPYGQAYEEDFGGILAGAFTQSSVRDMNEIVQVFAGGADGNLYLLYSGGNDAGGEFIGEALALVSVGPERTAIKKMEWWGDSTVQWFVGKKLDIPFDVMQLDALCDGAPDSVTGEEHNSHWQVNGPMELVHGYVLMRLASHSADGTTALSVPPHIPLENYGRVWLTEPLAGASRGR